MLPLDEVKNAVIAITANWYSLAIQLDIDYTTRKVRIDIHAHCIRVTIMQRMSEYILTLYIVYTFVMYRSLSVTTHRQKLGSMPCCSTG